MKELDLDDPTEELLAAGVSQLAYLAALLTLIHVYPELATVEFAVVAWVSSAVVSTVSYLVVSDRLANQRADVLEVEDVG